MLCLFLILVSMDLVLTANFQEFPDHKFEPDTNYQYPFVVVIRMPYKDNVCTGALLTSKWILTAAHCVNNENNVTVYIKSFTRNDDNFVNSDEDQPNIQERRSVQIVLPWIWTSHQIRQPFGISDIALIEIDEEFDRKSYLRRVPMPTSPEQSISNGSCKIVGLGTIANDESEHSEVVVAYDIHVEKKCSSNRKLVEESVEKSRNWICQIDDRSFKEEFVAGGSLLLCDGNHKDELNGVAAGTFRIESRINTSANKVVFMNICPYLTMIRSYVGHSIISSPGWQGNDCFRSSSGRTEFTALRAPAFVILLLLLMFIKLFV